MPVLTTTEKAAYDAAVTAAATIKGAVGATDNAIVRVDGTGTKTVQGSLVTIDDSGNVSLAALATVDGRDVSVDGTKLDGIASGAQVCSAANVQTACAALASALAVNGQKITGLAAGTAAGNAVRYEQAILADGTNAFSADQSMGSHKLTNVTDPSSTTSQDAATANWVTTLVGTPALALWLFGDGADGTLSAGFGTVTLTRDTYYSSVTFQAGDVINTANFKLFVSGTLNIAAADAGAIKNDGLTGNAGVTAGTAGATKTATALGTLGAAGNGSAGRAGGTAAGSNGTAGTSTNPGQGGNTGLAGNAGSGSGGAGGTRGGGATCVTPMIVHRHMVDCIRGATLLAGASGGGGGGGGGGDGTSGGGGGSGGTGGGTLWVCARTIARGTNSNVGVFRSIGGTGGAGGAATAGNRGGGGGGSGGGGGWVYIAWLNSTGSTITNGVDASGGTGGAGGNGFGTGIGGDGGVGGGGGRIDLVNLLTGAVAETTGSAGSAGTAGSGVTGGGGGAGNTLRANF